MSNTVKCVAVGDLGFVGAALEMTGEDGGQFPFDGIVQGFAGADLVLGNMEIPLLEPGSRSRNPVIPQSLVSETRAAASLKNAGFNLLTLANNHIMDHGADGLRSTMKALRGVGIEFIGAGEDLGAARRPFIKDVRGITVGILAYSSAKSTWASLTSPGSAPMKPEIVEPDLEALRKQVDVVVLSLHFGQMYTDYPQLEDQRVLRKWRDQGASVILGHHPHYCQGVEEYNKGLIAYSLGEFVFDPRAGNVFSSASLTRRRDTMILDFEIDGTGLNGWGINPVLIGDDLVPALAGGTEADRIRNFFESISGPLRGDGLSEVDVSMHTGARITAHEFRVLLFHVKRLNVRYLLQRLFNIRPRHVRMAAGWLRHAFKTRILKKSS